MTESVMARTQALLARGARTRARGRVRRNAAEPEEDDGPGQPPWADAERLEGDDLGIGRKPGQPAQNAHQDGHRQGEGQDGRDEEAEDAQGPEERHALVDEEFGQEQDLVHQQDEGDEKQSDEERRDDLAQNVPVDELGHRAEL